jgi:hypothetical protein
MIIMKAMKKDLQSITKGLKRLLKKTERIERELDKLPSARRGRPSAKAKGTRGPVRHSEQSVTDRVYTVIEKSRRGATTTQIGEKTGFDNKKIWNAINRLKTQKKIKSARRGIYVAI